MTQIGRIFADFLRLKKNRENPPYPRSNSPYARTRILLILNILTITPFAE